MLELNEILKDNTNYNNDKIPSKKKSERKERQKRKNRKSSHQNDVEGATKNVQQLEWYQSSAKTNQRPTYNYQSARTNDAKSESSHASNVNSVFCGLTLTEARLKRLKIIQKNLTIILSVLLVISVRALINGTEHIKQNSFEQFDYDGAFDALDMAAMKDFDGNTNTLNLAKRFMQMQEILRPISGYDALLDANSPQFLALDWIANRDLYQIDPTNPLLIQRYALAVLYFATNGQDWKKQLNWLSKKHECDWNGDGGVRKCNQNGEVTDLSLWNNLKGTIPSELMLLSELEILYLSRNELRGTIPTEIANLQHLTYLGLQHNKLTGTIPKFSFSGMSSLKYLYLEKNDLTGTISRSEYPCLLMKDEENNGSEHYVGAPSFGSSTGSLEFFTTDCRALLSIKKPEITCACCTECYLA